MRVTTPVAPRPADIGLLWRCWPRRRRSARPHLPVSVRVRTNLVWSTARWSIAAAAIIAITGLLFAEDAQSAALAPSCANSFAGRVSLLHVWIAVATLRVLLGAVLRFALTAKWDVTVHPYEQAADVYHLVRAEFVLALLSVMWTTVRWRWAGCSSRTAGRAERTAHVPRTHNPLLSLIAGRVPQHLWRADAVLERRQRQRQRWRQRWRADGLAGAQRQPLAATSAGERRRGVRCFV